MTQWSRIVAGADLAFVRDAAALVFVSERQGVFRVEHEREWKPGEKPLKPSVVFRESMTECVEHAAESYCCDDHYLASVLEETEKYDIEHVRFPSDQDEIALAFVRVRVLFGAGLIDLSRASDRLVEQLKGTMGKPTASGGYHISHKRLPGQHGDLARAFVSGCYALEYGGQEAFRGDAPMTDGARRMPRATRHPETGDRPGYMHDLPPRR